MTRIPWALLIVGLWAAGHALGADLRLTGLNLGVALLLGVILGSIAEFMKATSRHGVTLWAFMREQFVGITNVVIYCAVLAKFVTPGTFGLVDFLVGSLVAVDAWLAPVALYSTRTRDVVVNGG